MSVQARWLDDVTVELSKQRTDGTWVVVKTSWANATMAEENVERAIVAFEKRFNEPGRIPGQRNKTWHKGNFFFHVMTGPPTWWKPLAVCRRRPDGTEFEIVLGWLRLGVSLAYQR